MSPLVGEHPEKPTYRILDRLGSRSGDLVFLAHHQIFGADCVQKTVRMHGLEDALARSEPEFLNGLDHPRIVPVREAQWDKAGENAITFVMPFFPGGSVHEALVEDYRFSISQALTIAIDALDALGYLHAEIRALHRDTKPGNILLDSDRARGHLSDFGSAAAIGPAGDAAAVLGTDIYRPPECRLTGRVGIAADLYGVGLTLFEMLNGRIAWETLDPQKVERRLQNGRRAFADSQLQFAPHVPERLRRCVRKAISRESRQRFASAEAFITALRKVSCLDWAHVEGDGLAGEWRGTWPPHLARDRRMEYRLTSRILQGGRDAGKVRVESDYRGPGGQWRQTAKDLTLELDGLAAGLAKAFDAVEASAAHRSPAR